MRVIIKMSVIQGSGLNGNWGLVRQVGPWRPTNRDRVGAGYTQGNKEFIRPYVVKGNKPPPKLSHWAQRSIVSKKAYDNGFRKSGPGMRYNAVSASLLGISNTMQGIGARGSGMGVSQGNQTVDVNGRQGNAPGVEDPVLELPSLDIDMAWNDYQDSTDPSTGVSGPTDSAPISASSASSGGQGLPGVFESLRNLWHNNPIVMNDMPGEYPDVEEVEAESPPQYENNYGIYNPYPDQRESLPTYQPQMNQTAVGRRPIVWSDYQIPAQNYNFPEPIQPTRISYGLRAGENVYSTESESSAGPSRGAPLRIDTSDVRRNPPRGARRSPIVESDQSSGRNRSGGSSFSG